MQKVVCVYDNDKHQLIHRKIVASDYVLAKNETFTPTPDDQYPPYLFDGTKWTGLTLDQYKQVNDIKDPVPEVGGISPSHLPMGFIYRNDEETINLYKKYNSDAKAVVFFSNGVIWLPGNWFVGQQACQNDLPRLANGNLKHDFLTYNNQEKYSEYWADTYNGWLVLNPVNDPDKWDWSDVYFNDTWRQLKTKSYWHNRQKSVIYSYYCIGYFTDYDIEHYYGAKRKK